MNLVKINLLVRVMTSITCEQALRGRKILASDGPGQGKTVCARQNGWSAALHDKALPWCVLMRFCRQFLDSSVSSCNSRLRSVVHVRVQLQCSVRVCMQFLYIPRFFWCVHPLHASLCDCVCLFLQYPMHHHVCLPFFCGPHVDEFS